MTSQNLKWFGSRYIVNKSNRFIFTVNPIIFNIDRFKSQIYIRSFVGILILNLPFKLFFATKKNITEILPLSIRGDFHHLPTFTLAQLYLLIRGAPYKFSTKHLNNQILKQSGIGLIWQQKNSLVLYLKDNGLSYYHLLTETIACLLKLKLRYDLEVIIETSLKTRIPALESILNFYDIPVKDEVEYWQLEEFQLPSQLLSLRSIPNYPTKDQIMVLKAVNKQPIKGKIKSPKIYIMRSKKDIKNGRIVDNELELIKLLNSIGVVAIELESMSFLDQYRLFKQADLVISISGAGLTNILYMHSHASVIELIPKSEIKWQFMTISNFLNLNYFPIFIDTISSINHRPQLVNIDAEALDKIYNRALKI